MAFYCIDPINGNDTTGDGTASAPWATIAHAETQINSGTGYVSGDEIRIAGSTKSASLGTVQWKNTSSSAFDVDTDQDLTSSVSVGDYLIIGEETTAGAIPVPLLVKSISSTVINFYSNYQETLYSNVSYNIYKLSNVFEIEMNSYSDISASLLFNSLNTSFTAYNDDVIISGGWDPANFTSKTNYGKTAFGRTGTYSATSAFIYGSVFPPATTTTSSNGFLFKDFSLSRINLWRYQSSGGNTCGYNIDGLDYTYQGEATYNHEAGTRSIKNIGDAAGPYGIGSGGVSGNTTAFTSIDNWRVAICGNSSNTGQYFKPYSNYQDRVTSTTNIQIDVIGRKAGNLIEGNGYTPDFSAFTILNNNTSQTLGIIDTPSTISTYNTYTIPDAVADEVNNIAYDSNIYAAGFTFSSIDKVPDLHVSNNNYVLGPWGKFTVLDSSTGKKYNLAGRSGGTLLNTTDNATGSNCIQFTAFKSNQINGSLGLNTIAEPGQTLTLEISAKILGTTTSVTPNFYVFINNGTGYYTRMGSIAGGTTQLTKTAGTSFNNTSYDTLTYSVTLPQYSNYDNLYQYVVSLQANLPSGESLLIDSITRTIS